MTTLAISAKSVISRLEVKITGWRAMTWRIRIAAALMRFAAVVGGVSVNIELHS